MKRKIFLTTLLCASLCISSIAPLAAEAEEETGVETEFAETGVEAETEIETETEEEIPEERPEYTALDYVELGDYIGLIIEINPISVSEEEVLEEAENQVRNSDEMESAETVQDGDIVDIDYVGKIDGEEFSGGSYEGYQLTIGSGTFIEGFEEGLIGVNAGDTVDLDLTFPEYYYDDLAGQDVVFTVTVNEILRAPELTDEVASAVTDGEYTDVASWLDYIRSNLESSAEEDQEYEIQEALLNALAANSVVTGYPQDVVRYMIALSEGYYRELADIYSVTYEDFLAAYGYTEEEFHDALEELVEISLDEEMLLLAVAETEGITLSEEEYEAGAEMYAALYGFDSAEEFKTTYDEAYGDGMLRISLLMNKVFDFLEDNAVIEEIEEETETESETGADSTGIITAEEETASEPESETETEAGEE